MTAPNRAWIQRQLLQALVWGGYMGLIVLLGLRYGPMSSGTLAIALVVGFGLWGCSELLRSRALSRGWLSGPGYALAGKTALAVFLLPAIPQLILYVVLTSGLKFGWLSLPGGAANYTSGAVILYWINSIVPLGLWAGVWISTQAVRRYRQEEMSRLRAEAARSALEFEALRARLNPHFVFNALNNLRALINEDTERARDLVTRLSNTLRHALDHGTSERVTLMRLATSAAPKAACASRQYDDQQGRDGGDYDGPGHAFSAPAEWHRFGPGWAAARLEEARSA